MFHIQCPHLYFFSPSSPLTILPLQQCLQKYFVIYSCIFLFMFFFLKYFRRSAGMFFCISIFVSCLSNNACKNNGKILLNLLKWGFSFCVFLPGNLFGKCQHVFLCFGIFENTCDIGNFEFTHFHSLLQNVNPTANLMEIKHSFSSNPTFFVF